MKSAESEKLGRTVRIVRILLLVLELRKASTSEIARRLGVERRSVLRDLQLLSQLVPLKPVFEGRSRLWQLDPSSSLCNLGILDRISLVLGRELTCFLEGTALHEGLSRVEPEGIEAIGSVQGKPGRYSAHLDRKFRHLKEPGRSYQEHRETLDDLLDCLLRERRIILSYGPEGERRELEALTLVIYRRAVYLLARDPQRPESILRLSVDRIRELETGERFDYPQEWDPDAELEPYFGIISTPPPERVVLRFTAKVRRFVEARTWHPSQKVRLLGDGSVEVELRAGGRELVRWVLEWGENCRVVQPEWLREEVLAELRHAVQAYEESAKECLVPSPAARGKVTRSAG